MLSIIAMLNFFARIPAQFWAIGIPFLLILAVPFLLKPKESISRGEANVELVIVTPHAESIRREFGRAFVLHYREKTGKTVYIDWRTPGSGTSEIEKFLDSEFAARFELLWRKELSREWTPAVAEAFHNRKLQLPENSANDNDEQSRQRLARETFLNSDLGIGVDLFFGGGAYPFQKFAGKGYLVDSGVGKRHPEWFENEIIPVSHGGEALRDEDFRWVGASLSGFGICYNVDLFRRLGLDPPKSWEDLGQPALFGKIAMADPTKSGSVNRAFELLVQQQIHEQFAEIPSEIVDVKERAEKEEQALHLGWQVGMNLIQTICANARYFTDSATKIPEDVAMGNAAAGMCIDFYGRTYQELHRQPNGVTRVKFTLPTGGTSVGADPIALLRGAPNRDVAEAFIDFVLSIEGQKIWTQKVGSAGGPQKTAMHRMSIRRDFYDQVDAAHLSHPDDRPYRFADDFVYRGEWTGPLFNSLRVIIRGMCLDVHDEMTLAWKDLIARDFPEKDSALFLDVSLVGHSSVAKSISVVLAAAESDPMKQVRLARQLAGSFRESYRRARR